MPAVHWARCGLAVLMVAGAALVASSSRAVAHTPHDDIYDTTLSPTFAEDGTAFTISRGFLLKSIDRGRSWSRVVRGLDTTGDIVGVQISPKDPSTVFVATQGDGVYRSTDAGESWSHAGDSRGTAYVSRLVPSPHAAEVVLASGFGGVLFRSLTAGSTWEAIGQEALPAPVTSIAFLPDDPDHLMVGDSEGVVHRSTDGGHTWVAVPLGDAGRIRSIAASPTIARDGTVFVGTARGGVFKSVDGGQTFESASDGLTDRSITSVVVSEGYDDDHTVWVSSWDDGVATSEDGGRSWHDASRGLTTDSQAETSGYEERPDFGPLSVAPASANGRTMFVGGFAGLFRSVDAGRSWREVETLPSTILVGLAVSPAYADDGTVAVTTYYDGALRSVDRGQSWEPANEGLDTVGSGASARPTRLYGLAFSPAYASDQTVFSATGTGLLRSTDGARTWEETPLEAQPTGPRQLTIVVSPDFADDGTVLLGEATDGAVFRSTDRGATFERVGNVGSRVRSMVTSPDGGATSPLFAGAGHGVFRSTDRGTTWSRIGLPEESVAALAVSPGFSTDGTLLAGTGRGLFVSRDAGISWHRPPGTPFEGDSTIDAVALSPAFAEDGTALITVRGAGLFMSTDGGRSFTAMGSDLIDRNLQLDTYSRATASPIVFSPAYATDRTVYGFSGPHLLVSADAARTWTEVPYATAHHDSHRRADSVAPGAAVPVVVVTVAGVAATAGGAIALRRRRAGTEGRR
jgi:photosystem II stability/assembly factor-like uncharacterized protein